MAEIKRSTVIGVFPTVEQAERAMKELLQAGFAKEKISFLVRDEQRGEEMQENTEHYDEKTTTRTAAGVVTGGILGGLLGTVTAIAFPGIGTVVGVGFFIASLAGAGAIGGLFTGLMSSAGVTEEEARWFQGELEAGRPLVVVSDENRYSEALAIMQVHGAYDMIRQNREFEPAAATRETAK